MTMQTVMFVAQSSGESDDGPAHPITADEVWDFCAHGFAASRELRSLAKNSLTLGVPDLWTDLLACHRLFGGHDAVRAQLESTDGPPDLPGQGRQVAARGVRPRGARRRTGSYEAIRHHEGRSFAYHAAAPDAERTPAYWPPVRSACMSSRTDRAPGGCRRSACARSRAPRRTRPHSLGDARADDLNATNTGPPQFELWMRTPESTRLAPRSRHMPPTSH